MILRVHLVPALGHKKSDAIKSEDVQHLKRRLSTKAAKTVNNILAVLSILLKKAVEWDVIDRMTAPRPSAAIWQLRDGRKTPAFSRVTRWRGAARRRLQRINVLNMQHPARMMGFRL